MFEIYQIIDRNFKPIGTGKSFLIETICAKLNSIYQDFESPKGWIVAVLAPTGIAAYNVNGITIHRFFHLPVFGNSDEDKHWDLSNDHLKEMRMILQHLKLIIIGKFLLLYLRIEN